MLTSNNSIMRLRGHPLARDCAPIRAPDLRLASTLNQTESRKLVMTISSSSPSRRQVLATTAAAGALGLELSGVFGDVLAEDAAPSVAILPFRVHVPDADLADLKRRLAATRWPDKETVPDQSQGAQLANLQELVHYWATDYDWRKGEAKLNAFPQLMTTIDGVDIHFIHVRSRHPNALPLIITHGWPGSIFEQI